MNRGDLYDPPGEVAAVARLLSEVADGTRELLITSKAESGGVLVLVQDSGPGLPPGAVELTFEAFYTTKPGGLGMGLSICPSIIEAHWGDYGSPPINLKTPSSTSHYRRTT